MSCIRKKYDFYHKMFNGRYFLPVTGPVASSACFLSGASAEIAENFTIGAVWVIARMPFLSLAFAVAAYLSSSVRHCNIPVITVADFPSASCTAALVTGIFSCSAAAYTVNCAFASAKSARIGIKQTD